MQNLAISFKKRKEVADMKMNVAYLRVSTEAQTEKYGLDMQKQKILDYCEKKGVVIDKWYVDGGYSGSKLDRPEIQQLLDDAENGLVGKVYIYKLDRMSRDVIDTLNLLYRVLPKYGVQVISMTEDLRFENPMDKVMIGVNAIMGQYEREVIYMRTRAGMKERVKKGLWMGGGRIPWGYYYDRNDGILHPDEEQAEMVRNSYKLYLEGYSCDKIAKMLGFSAERIVSQILRRKSNIGIIEYKGEEYKGQHEPIVDEDTFYAVQELMKKRSTNSHVANNHILTGLCYCGVCGARMRYHKWDGRNPRFICYSQIKSKEYMQKDPDCNNSRPIASKIEKEVEEYFREAIVNVDESQETIDNSAIIEESIKKSNAKIKKLYNLYVESPSENLMEVIREEESALSALKEQLIEEKSHEKKTDVEKLERIRRVSDVWDSLTDKEKNRVLKECVERVTITNDDVEIRFIFLPYFPLTIKVGTA